MTPNDAAGSVGQLTPRVGAQASQSRGPDLMPTSNASAVAAGCHLIATCQGAIERFD